VGYRLAEFDRGQAEAILNAPPHGHQLEVLPIASPSASVAAQLSYVGEFCAHMADIAALNLNSGVVRDSYSFHGPFRRGRAQRPGLRRCGPPSRR